MGKGCTYRRLRTRAAPRAPPHATGPTFASFLIPSGLDVVFVSRQLGHANPAITLKVYSHLFAARDHAATAREALDASYAAVNGARVQKAAAVETGVETVDARG